MNKRLKFSGNFRDYQQAVLNNVKQHLEDGRVHIVAAPGSGKTILGLELICRLGEPALVLSPSVTIRQQWGERFEGHFIPADENVDDYVSFDIRSPKMLTSITYQALHAAVNREVIEEDGDTDLYETERAQDYSEFDLIKKIKEAGIKTVCLDEAHHLQSEWQKALEQFLSRLGTDTKIIALTATPPYDSTPLEWKRYTDVCGEIDEEIFVPQLVAQKTLCPHQDYIYFNYPTEQEIQVIKDYKARAILCSQQILESDFIQRAISAAGLNTSSEIVENAVLANPDGFSALFSIAEEHAVTVPTSIRDLTYREKYSLSAVERAFQLIIDEPELFTEEISELLKTKLSENALIEKRCVRLTSSDKNNKLLLSSVGKLRGIEQIVRSETDNLGDGLRMLILTDYIRKEMLSIVGTNEKITTMGAVPIFEAVRRVVGNNIKIAMLSGTLVIVDNCVSAQIADLAAAEGISCSLRPIDNTNHSVISIQGSNKNKVSLLTKAFGQGLINILVGTKSLLGEGWDSPCINSLILASFVGSFMLSNQMRGRAIRVDKNNPSKISNIWHLVAIEPQICYDDEKLQQLYIEFCEGENELISNDYDTMKRRFEGFLAPAYNSDIIENGVDRLDIITPPFNREGIDNINTKMLALAADRAAMANRWNAVVKATKHPEVVQVNEVSNAVQPKGFLYRNMFWTVIAAVIILAAIIVGAAWTGGGFLATLLKLVFIAIGTAILLKVSKKVLSHITAEKTVKTFANALLKTLCDMDQIKSNNARISIEKSKDGKSICCSLVDATAHEKSLFSKALGELLSTIDEPRYVIVKQTKFLKSSIDNFTMSYACPAVIGTKKETAQLFAGYLKSGFGIFNVYYTNSDDGRKILAKCKRRSYINVNSCISKAKKTIR